MRISDWSSDVCSSDLWSSFRPLPRCRARPDRLPLPSALPIRHPVSDIPKPPSVRNRHPTVQRVASAMPQQDEARGIAHAAHIPASSDRGGRSEEHTSELQSLMRISYAVFCLKKKKITHNFHTLSTSSYLSSYPHLHIILL